MNRTGEKADALAQQYGGIAASFLASFFLAFWIAAYWQEYLLFHHRVGFGITDPIFGEDAGFYVFALPLLQALPFMLAPHFLPFPD
jgi:uncharacterized membrane protein (UPF0182 family)